MRNFLEDDSDTMVERSEGLGRRARSLPIKVRQLLAGVLSEAMAHDLSESLPSQNPKPNPIDHALNPGPDPTSHSEDDSCSHSHQAMILVPILLSDPVSLTSGETAPYFGVLEAVAFHAWRGPADSDKCPSFVDDSRFADVLFGIIEGHFQKNWSWNQLGELDDGR
jgi:hypothetical protein